MVFKGVFLFVKKRGNKISFIHTPEIIRKGCAAYRYLNLFKVKIWLLSYAD